MDCVFEYLIYTKLNQQTRILTCLEIMTMSSKYLVGISTFALALTVARATNSCNWGFVGGALLAEGDCIVPYSSYNESGSGGVSSWRVFCNYTDDSVEYGQGYAEFYEGTDSCEDNKLDYVEKLDYYECCQTCEYVAACESYEMSAYIYDKYNTSDCSDDDAIGHYLDLLLYQAYGGCYDYGGNETSFFESARYEFEEDEFRWIIFNQSDCIGSPIYNFTFRDGCYYMPSYGAYVMTSINGYNDGGDDSGGPSGTSGASLLMQCNVCVNGMSVLLALTLGFSLCNQ